MCSQVGLVRRITGAGPSSVRSASVRAAVNMCRLLLAVALLCIQIDASSQAPPRLGSCRLYYKSKQPSLDIYTFSASEGACGIVVNFPVPVGETINITDTRNCQNYYKCEVLTCQQCPCPLGETFNPVTKQCDTSNALCQCASPPVTDPPTSSSSATTAAAAAAAVSTPTGDSKGQITKGTDSHSGSNDSSGAQNKSSGDEISTETIIIAAIVSATVIIIVIIVMAVFLWQKGRTAQSKPAGKSLPPAEQDGYAPAMPPSERHVYAEIDEHMFPVNGRGRHWNHGGSVRAPPLPDHQPPLSNTSSPCPHHYRSDSGVGSTDNSFHPVPHTHHHKHYPHGIHQQQHTNPHCVRYVKEKHMLAHNNPVRDDDSDYHNAGDESVSSDSQYSCDSSQHTSIDSNDIDMKTPLHHPTSTHNYVSKQVYI